MEYQDGMHFKGKAWSLENVVTYLVYSMLNTPLALELANVSQLFTAT